MKNLNLTQHIGNKCPVRPDDFVVYRTISDDDISHVHLPQQAILLNWKKPILGRIYSYQVVNLTKLGVSKLYTKRYQDVSI